jgi:two-component system phosphate regulon sensor histidine kinase PhoR
MNRGNENRTGKLDAQKREELSLPQEAVIYRPVPYSPHEQVAGRYPVWRVRLDLWIDPPQSIGLDINGEVTLGRGPPDEPGLVDLTSYGAAALGVSRRHLLLRPTADKLYAVDLNSTNGTRRNEVPLGASPYPLVDKDVLAMGDLYIGLNIIGKPSTTSEFLMAELSPEEALTRVAKAVTSQLALDEVLSEVVDLAVTMTRADEATLWLVEEETQEMWIEAQRGVDDETARRTRLAVVDSLAGRVVQTGRPVIASHEVDGRPIKIKTGYLVESIIYVPLALAGTVIGVLSVANHDPDRTFTERDVKLVSALADFAAIAIQNARTYQATDRALARRVEELAMLHDLSQAVNSSLRLDEVFDALTMHINRGWDIEAGALWLIDERTNKLHVMTSTGIEGALDKVSLEVGQGIVGRVVAEDAPLIVNDAPTHPHFNTRVDVLTDLKTRSIMAVPLIVKGQVIGALDLRNKRDGVFDDGDLRRLEAFTAPVAAAIENVRLFEKSEKERATIRATIRNLSQPILIVNEFGELVLANPDAEKLLELSQGDAGRAFLGLLGAGELATLFAETVAEQVGRTAEIRLGNQVFLATIDPAPQVGAIIVMQDITHLKALEQAHSDFMDELSHDLRSPLTSIMAFAGLMQRAGALNEKQTEIALRAERVSRSLLALVDQLLDMRRIELGMKLDLRPCDAVEVARRARDDLQGVALLKDISLEMLVQGEPHPIQADGMRLYRAISNLVDNAIKYSPRESAVQIGVIFGSDDMRIAVSDNGPGIPADQLPHVFEKFYRGQDAEEQAVGLGLGLYMVRSTVEAHGGQVEVESVEGQGVTFTLRLPTPPQIEA